jgi:hypothetical protein
MPRRATKNNKHELTRRINAASHHSFARRTRSAFWHSSMGKPIALSASAMIHRPGKRGDALVWLAPQSAGEQQKISMLLVVQRIN